MAGAVFTILLLTAVGLPLGIVLAPKQRWGIVTGLAFLLGAGEATLLLFLLSTAGIPWSRTSFGLSLIPIVLITAVLARHAWRDLVNRREPRVSHSIASITTDALVGLTVIAHAAYVAADRIVEWDYVANWGLKAKAFFLFRGIDWSFLNFPDYQFMQPDYPLMTPLSFDLVALVNGRWDDRWPGLIATAFGASLILIVRDLLRDEIEHPMVRGIATLALASAALSPWVGLGEPALIAYGASALLLLARGIDRDPRLVNTGALLLGLAMWSKNEGTALFLAVAAAIVLSSRERFRNLLRLWPAVAIALPWAVVRVIYGFKPVYFQGDFLSRAKANLAQAGELLQAMVMFWPEKRIFWIAILLTLAWKGKALWPRYRFLMVTLGIAFLIFIAQNFITPFGAVSHVQFSWHRLIYGVAVPLGFLAVIGLGLAWERPTEKVRV